MNGFYGPDLGIHRGLIEIKNLEELQDALEKHAKKNPTRALLKVPLKTPPSKDVSNNQLFQLKNINDHERFCVLPS
jgi:hypothetical protein